MALLMRQIPAAAEVRNVCHLAMTQLLGGNELNDPVAARNLASLYLKLHENPNYVLAPTESALVTANRYEPYIQAFKDSQGMQRKLRLFVSSYEKVKHLQGRHGQAIRELSERLLKNPSAYLNENEWSMIEQAGVDDDFRILRQIPKQYGPWIHGLTRLSNTHKRAFLALMLGAGAVEYSSEKRVSDPDRKADSLKSDEFEIIYYSPLPHSDIQIGNTIYSFSTGDVKRMSFQQRQKTSPPHLYGSSRRIRFKPGKDDVQALHSFLDEQVGQKYFWVPPYFSCVSATHEAVRKCTRVNLPPPGIDRSPALTEAWFKLRKLTGDPKIADVRFHSKENLALDKAKEMSVNLIDTLYFLSFLPDFYLTAQFNVLKKPKAKP